MVGHVAAFAVDAAPNTTDTVSAESNSARALVVLSHRPSPARKAVNLRGTKRLVVGVLGRQR